MKLIEFRVQEDFGKDIYIHLLVIKRWCLFQSCLSFMEYGRSWPYLNITMGSGRLFGLSFQVLWFGITFEIFTRNWFK